MHFQEGPSRESVQRLVKTCLEICRSRSDRSLLASSLQRTFSAAWPEYRVAAVNLKPAGIWIPNHGGKCSSELRTAKTENLDNKPTVPTVLAVIE